MRTAPIQIFSTQNVVGLICALALSATPVPAFSKDAQEISLTEAMADVKSLDVYVEGDVIHMLSGESELEKDVVHLFYRRSSDGGASWTEPVRVDAVSAPPHGLQRGMDAQLAAAGKHLIAIWSTAGTGSGDSGPLTTATSADGGLSWQPGPNPANDGSTSGHEFIDVLADRRGFHVVWLEGLAQTGKKPLFGFFKNAEEAQGLHYARSGDKGQTWTAQTILDTQTCECCSNKLAGGSDGTLYTLYRDIKPRDMRLAVGHGEHWNLSAPVGDFAWNVDACPHTGGGLAVLPGKDAPVLHAAVWTGKNGQAGVYHLVSTDGGKTWGEPHKLGDALTKYPDIAATARGDITMVWNGLAGDDRKAAVFGALSADGGHTWSAQRRLSALGVVASHPIVIAVAGQFKVFWTQSDGRHGHRLVIKNM